MSAPEKPGQPFRRPPPIRKFYPSDRREAESPRPTPPVPPSKPTWERTIPSGKLPWWLQKDNQPNQTLQPSKPAVLDKVIKISHGNGFVYQAVEGHQPTTPYEVTYPANPIHEHAETVLKEAAKPVQKPEPTILVKEDENGFRVFSSAEGHNPTAFKKLIYKRNDIPEDSRKLKQMDTVLKEAASNVTIYKKPDVPLIKIPRNLLINPKEIPYQRGMLRSMESTPTGVDEYEFIRSNRNLTSIATIGSGFDLNIFKNGKEGKQVYALDPLYQSPEMIRTRAIHSLRVLEIGSIINKANELVEQDGTPTHGYYNEMFQIYSQYGSLNTPVKDLLPNIAADIQRVIRQYTGRIYSKSVLSDLYQPDTDSKAIMDEFIQKIYDGNENVHLITCSADSLPLSTGTIDRVISDQCISCMGLYYDLLCTSVLEGLRIMKRNGDFEILPWQDDYYEFFGSTDIYTSTGRNRVWIENKRKLESLLSRLGVQIETQKVQHEVLLKRVIFKHSDRSFAFFQDPNFMANLIKPAA